VGSFQQNNTHRYKLTTNTETTPLKLPVKDQNESGFPSPKQPWAKCNMRNHCLTWIHVLFLDCISWCKPNLEPKAKPQPTSAGTCGGETPLPILFFSYLPTTNYRAFDGFTVANTTHTVRILCFNHRCRVSAITEQTRKRVWRAPKHSAAAEDAGDYLNHPWRVETWWCRDAKGKSRHQTKTTTSWLNRSGQKRRRDDDGGRIREEDEGAVKNNHMKENTNEWK
jgi:hypothetical protein